MLKKIGIALLIIVALAGVALYFLKSGRQAKTADVDLQYDFSTVQRVDMSEKVDATGSVVAVQNTDLYPAYSGTVRQITVKVGDSVRKGQVLMTVDSPQLATEWVQDQSDIRQSQSNLTLAANDLSRTKTLFAAEGTTRDVLDTAQNKYDVAREQLNLAQFKLSQLQNYPDHVNSLAADRRSLNICAPSDGQVAWLNVRQGDPAAPANSLITLVAAGSLMVEAQVAETDIQNIKPGQAAGITMNDEAQTQLKGTVFAIGSVGKDNSGVIEYPVRIQVEPGPFVLKPQMTADISIVTSDHPNALAVPSAAVVQRRGHSMVAVRQDKEVVYTRVTTGVSNDTDTEILDGLKEGDTIAVKRSGFTGSPNNGGNNGNRNSNGNGNGNGNRNNNGGNRNNNRRMMPF